jgi:restriction endonuclease Mrr
LGGGGKAQEVLGMVFSKMENQLTEADLSRLPNGRAIRWKNYVRWARQHLKDKGYLKQDSPRGLWEITEEGKTYYENER